MSFKKVLVLTVLFITGIDLAMARDSYRLNQAMDVKILHRGLLEQAVQLPAGTIVEVDFSDSIGPQRYIERNGRVVMSRGGWVRLRNIELNRAPRYGSELEYGVSRFQQNSRFDDYFISSGIGQMASLIRSNRGYVTSAPVHTTTRTVTTTSFNSYEVCYSQPRTVWVTQNEAQARAGRRNALIGTGAAIAGILLSGSNDRGVSNVGTAIAVGGAAMAVVGLVQVSSSQNPITVHDQRCDQYYTRDTQVRTVYIDNRRCTTERYYSRSWDREVEYFQTTCSGSRYYTFERNSQIW
jgi:hypothetical protein